jgi:DNA-binding transcriptional MerR regulator
MCGGPDPLAARERGRSERERVPPSTKTVGGGTPSTGKYLESKHGQIKHKICFKHRTHRLGFAMCNDQFICDYRISQNGTLYFIVMSGDNLLSLDELTTEVTRLLNEYGLSNVHQDHRVSPVPDLRTIRYYTSLGLVDRPIADPPRQAKYKMRHVWQLLAIKALQGSQMSLAQVQERLYGLNEEELKSLVEAVHQSFSRKGTSEGEVKPILWREFVVAPGLKVLVAEGWSLGSETDRVLIQEKLRVVLEVSTRASSG